MLEQSMELAEFLDAYNYRSLYKIRITFEHWRSSNKHVSL